jgi:hypothetical protein
MKHFNWQILLGLSLIALSVAFYLLHYAIFRDPHHIFIRLRQNTLKLAAGMNGGANALKLEQRPSSSDAIGYGRRCPQ